MSPNPRLPRTVTLFRRSAIVNAENATALPELAATSVRALVLYSLAEFQAGTVSTIRVTVDGASFSVSDNGRGHSIDKMVEGTSYLRFIYTHFDYPFEAKCAAPVQLQGIGMSLLNALCSELQLTVKKRDAKLTLRFRDGQLRESTREGATTVDTGITIAATIASHLCGKRVASETLEAWLLDVLATAPALQLVFNGRHLKAPPISSIPQHH